MSEGAGAPAKREEPRPGRPEPVLSICLLNWNTLDFLRRCLESLRAAPPRVPGEIIVVDNASTDGSAAMVAAEFPEVRVIANPVNLEYARGNNQAIAASRGEIVLLLNPDTEVTPGALDRIVSFLQANPTAGAAAPRLIYPDGSPQQSVRAFPAPGALLRDVLGRSGGYRTAVPETGEPVEVDQPMAAALALRRDALAEVGTFDERFPMFFNDVDLCYRLRQAGWKIYALPEAVIVHHLGASTRQVRARMLRASHAGLIAFYRKHYRSQMSPPLFWLTLAAIWLSGWLRGIKHVGRERLHCAD
jgi:hypothetical protein